jgi:hypothetical protein
VGYNLVSFLLWSAILLSTLQYIFNGPHIVPPSSSQNATRTLGAVEQARQFISGLGERFFGFPPVHSNPVKPFTNVATGSSSKLNLLPQALAAFLGGSYASPIFSHTALTLGKGLALGPFVTWTQSLAVLEVLHAATGIVKSSVAASVMQVASRVWMVWGVVEMRSEVSLRLRSEATRARRRRLWERERSENPRERSEKTTIRAKRGITSRVRRGRTRIQSSESENQCLVERSEESDAPQAGEIRGRRRTAKNNASAARKPFLESAERAGENTKRRRRGLSSSRPS